LKYADDHLTDAEAAETWLSHDDLVTRWRIPLKTVRRWRQDGIGPEGIRLNGSVRYRLSEVRRWEREKEREQRDALEAV
jgi:hypothetical protein